MSVDRSYLDSKAARHYQDRKMAKWMGFFLSEHQTALKKVPQDQALDCLPIDQVFLQLNQAFVGQYLISITYLVKRFHNKEASYQTSTGYIQSLDSTKLTLSLTETPNQQIIDFIQIISIQLVEESSNEITGF
ncbi:hypothetical protein [Facklamia hominis]|uniref:hypothetical protein n=1 Tax=Facklamia hominis TaxID=178214 RepID=UPI0038FD0FC0